MRKRKATATKQHHKNILFIITDQQRADCLSLLGHPLVKTPNLDRLASQGVTFTDAFTTANPCGPSRACIDTGRYTHAHRSAHNEVSLPDDETTMGTYFSKVGYRAGWIGKSYYVKDYFLHPPEPGHRFVYDYDWYQGPPPGWEDCGFVMCGSDTPYHAYLKEKGYPEGLVRSGYGCKVITPEGELMDPGEYRAAQFPTAVKAEDSETAFFINRTMEFILQSEAKKVPWIAQVNIFNPHSHFVAPAPYHAMYDPEKVPINRHPDELKDLHPLHRVYRMERGAMPLDDEKICRQLRAAYYGMITEIDDHVGRLMKFMKEKDLLKNTLIVFTSDHGEFLGDHWCIQKEMWFDESIRVPLIVCDPSGEADKTRGRMEDAPVELIDLLPTFMEYAGISIPHHIQGKSLLPILRGGSVPEGWRTEIYADWDFRFFWSMRELGLRPEQCRMWLVRDKKFKYVFFNALPDILYDLTKDPQEFHNVAGNPDYKDVVEEYRKKLLVWRMSNEDNSRIGWTYGVRPKFGANPFTFGTPWRLDD